LEIGPLLIEIGLKLVGLIGSIRKASV